MKYPLFFLLSLALQVCLLIVIISEKRPLRPKFGEPEQEKPTNSGFRLPRIGAGGPLFVVLTLFLLSVALLPLHKLDAKAPSLPPSPPPMLLKPEASGVYQDAKGGTHPWSIGQAHILNWENSPYLPVGASFTPQSWSGDGTDVDWVKDQAALKMLSQHGVREVTLSAGSKGLTHVTASSVQRVLDYLEANGFHYGLEIADFPKDPLIGYVIKPSVYRNPVPSTTSPTLFRHIPDLAGAFYLLVSPHDGEIDESGRALRIDGETAQVTLKSTQTDDVLLLYPERLYLAGTPESHLPDLWEGYDEYRDRVLSFFSRIKLGPGFRFFLDPLTEKLGFSGEVDNVIPTTDGFRLDFEAWLNKKYNHNVDDLNRGWGIMDKNLPDFTVAARCLPLWSGTKGVPAVYDPVKKTAYVVLNKPRIGGHVWGDFTAFRLESVRGYMNAMADVLKKGVADVPVVYQWGGRSALLTNSDTHGGFDGISMPASDSGTYAFAQAEESPRTTWLIGASSGMADDAVGDWNALKNLGARGFYASARTGDQAQRLAEYGASLSFEATDLNIRPRVLPYPAGVNGLQAEVRRLRNGVWWLPSYRVGALFDSGDFFTLGPLLRGYRLTDPDGARLPRFVVWSPRGAMTQARFPFPKDARPLITDSAGVPLKVDKKKDTWTVPVGAEPIVLSQISSVPLPLDAADAADKEATRLLKLAKDQGLATDLMQERLFYAQKTIEDTPENADLRYNALSRAIDEISQALQPYVWIEGESATSFTFDSLVSDSEASGGSYLSLDTDRQPPSTGAEEGGYHADYKFSVNSANTYALWIASSPTRDSAPFTWKIDDGGDNEVQDVTPEGGLYAGKFEWSHIGDTTLRRGPHTLTITVSGPRPLDNRYTLAIDAFCLSRVPFHPDGTNLPAIDFPPPPDDKKKKK